MRIGRFTISDDEQPWTGVVLPTEGIVVHIAEAGQAAGIPLPPESVSLLKEWEWKRKTTLSVEHARETGDAIYDRTALEQHAPISDPSKIIGVGLNYRDHAEESESTPPEEPVLFAKFSSALIGPDGPVRWDPALTSEVDSEAELCVVIGTRARQVNKADARSYIAGYAPGNDVSARDIQFSDEQWVRGKSLDSFASIGPEIVTPDEITDPHDLDIWAELNGERLQDSNTRNLIHDIDDLISFCSRAFTLYPGDIIYTGTPAGVGIFREPPALMSDGDTITVGIEDLGELTNYCKHG